MVRLEETQAGRHALWIDGNEPAAEAVYRLTSALRLEELGIASEVSYRHQLVGYAARRRLGKERLWKHLLGAQLEQQLLDAGGTAERVEAFLLRPPAVRLAQGPLALGPRPASSRRRANYVQAVVLCDEQDTEAARAAISSLSSNLYFDSSEQKHFDDYAGFEAECRRLLTSLVNFPCYGDPRVVPVLSGFEISRVLP